MGADLEIGAQSVARPRAECYKPVLRLLQLDRGASLFELGPEVIGVFS